MTNWISVKDRLPEEKGEYIILWEYDGEFIKPHVTTAYYDELMVADGTIHKVWRDHWQAPLLIGIPHIKAWMPLPDPPEE